jgi:hypothetical protein
VSVGLGASVTVGVGEGESSMASALSGLKPLCQPPLMPMMRATQMEKRKKVTGK